MNQTSNVLGIELGSTRIKSVLIDSDYRIIATGSFAHENQLLDGVWTYDMEEIFRGVRACYSSLRRDFEEKYGEKLTKVGAIGISGMMHGYIALDKNNELLVPFRTWRNTITGDAAARLSSLFGKNIPQRWSIAHLMRAMMLCEEHLPSLCRLTTLSGYIHSKLTGKNVLGICEASGMFPIDSKKFDYHSLDAEKFDALAKEMGYDFSIRELLPKVLCAGEDAGYLTEEGALFLDESGQLHSGIPFAPPEGDGGTGMTSTNTLRIGTGNVSAGTSGFSMVVVDHELNAHEEIDMVTTPSGAPVAMVHCNNCTSDINAWARLFGDFLHAMGKEYTDDELYSVLFNSALAGEPDGGGLMAYNYESGEHIMGVCEGRPLFMRCPGCEMTLANFMRTHLYSALASLKIGFNILTDEENVKIDKLYAHGGFFRVPKAGQEILSAAFAAPVSVMETADSGGPYGMALLAAYRINGGGESLEDHLERRVFSSVPTVTLMAKEADIVGFRSFLSSYVASFDVEKMAIEKFKMQ